MKHKFNIIQINGFKGVLLAIFLIGCFAAGFFIFPGWICMNLWNFTAGYFSAMPKMTLLHGSMLWCIVALSSYALNKDNFAISIGTAKHVPPSEERIKEIIKQINEKNAQVLPIMKNNDIIDEENAINDEDDIVSR